jgi:hypothetical protein
LDGPSATITACRKHEEPYLSVVQGMTGPSDVGVRIVARRAKALKVASNREPNFFGLGRRVEAFLARVVGDGDCRCRHCPPSHGIHPRPLVAAEPPRASGARSWAARIG